MGNDSKLWLARIAFWTTSTLDGSLAIKVGTDAGKGGGLPVGWTILLVLLTGVTIYCWLLTRQYKANRGKDTGMNMNQIEVEALAAYGADIIKKRQEQQANPKAPSPALPGVEGLPSSKTPESAADHPQNRSQQGN